MTILPSESAGLKPDQRRREIAAILARGILRLHCMRQVDPEPAGDAPETDESSLAAPTRTPSRPHVTGG
jgi:hypothetical protein